MVQKKVSFVFPLQIFFLLDFLYKWSKRKFPLFFLYIFFSYCICYIELRLSQKKERFFVIFSEFDTKKKTSFFFYCFALQWKHSKITYLYVSQVSLSKKK